MSKISFYQARHHLYAILILSCMRSNLDPETASSYRPISNLLYISKVIECVVASRFSSYLSHQLPARQSAYRPFHSTETAVLSVHNVNDVVRSIDNGQVSLLEVLDLIAAFDRLPSTIRCYFQYLLSDRFVVANNALTWFTSYLTDRTQQFM